MRINLHGFVFLFYSSMVVQVIDSKRPKEQLRTYCASKYRYFNTLIILLTSSSSMLILLYSGECGQSLVPTVRVRTGTAVIQQEVYTGSDCAMEYWVAYHEKGNHKEGMKAALRAQANVYPWFSELTSKVLHLQGGTSECLIVESSTWRWW